MHSILFKNCENSWKNALPLGNGCFGAMAFYKDNALSLPMNHYEVYYSISDSVLPEDMLKDTPVEDDPGKIHKSYYERAERNQPIGNEPFYYYRLDKAKKLGLETSFFSGSYPSTGELVFILDESLREKESRLRLDIEDAKVRFSVADKLKAETYVLRRDAIVTNVRGKGAIKAIKLEYPEARDRKHPAIDYTEIDSECFLYVVKIPLSDTKDLHLAGVIRLIGAKGRLTDNVIEILESEDEFTALTSVFTSCTYSDPIAEGLAVSQEHKENLAALTEEHKQYWHSFFDRSSITIPDKFLEKVYYINQYALDCSSGKDGYMKHHACGLNGLWDIRHPNLWGSMWYWDVNIQAAFAGVFSSNRLDLGKVFSDGLLTYVKLAERFAKDVHNMNGASIDYPYHFYYSTWPWCAQYLWSQYEYSGDVDYLREEAYPLFLKLCEFSCEVFKYDEGRGEYVIYPDISPEQGPLSHNTVITVASVKYMLKFTLEAAKILNDKSEILVKVKHLYENLPAYPTVTDDYGTRFKDSEDAPANLWIRHPSMLMPIFPTGEIDIDSPKELCDIAINTVKFLEEHCEIGVFQVSWLAAVAARMGDGQRALRLLYEMGIDHLLRSNGLAAEENERFMNYCLIMRQPLYYPCMMEFTGEMLAAVNEMLMQSNAGIIRLFPAMPNGEAEYDRINRHGYALNEYGARYNEYPAWENVSFDRLLARGAFEVSSQLKNSKILYLKIKSIKGARVKITSPYSLSDLGIPKELFVSENTVEFDTDAGKEYIFGKYEAENAPTDDICVHTSYTKRKVFIGEDEHTSYHKALDAFTRDWYLGNVRMENHTVYKFDFGSAINKDYQSALYRTCFGAEPMLLHTMAFNKVDPPAFTTLRGYGFDSAEGIKYLDRGAPDELLRDFAEGEGEREFLIEAPRGQYELLCAIGDQNEDSVTILECEEGRRVAPKALKAGRFSAELIPIVHEEDGPIRLKISTTKGNKWKLNYVILNLYKQF